MGIAELGACTCRAEAADVFGAAVLCRASGRCRIPEGDRARSLTVRLSSDKGGRRRRRQLGYGMDGPSKSTWVDVASKVDSRGGRACTFPKSRYQSS